MYGAFWCSHCLEQKEEFGQQAMKDFPYVECYPDGFGKVRPVTWRLSGNCVSNRLPLPAYLVRAAWYMASILEVCCICTAGKGYQSAVS